MSAIDDLQKRPPTWVSLCIYFVAVYGDESARMMAERAAQEYLSAQHAAEPDRATQHNDQGSGDTRAAG